MNDTKSSMRTIYPTDEDCHRICRVSSSGKTCIDVFIRPINEKQAKDISDDKSIIVNHNGQNIELNNANCYATGKIDINDLNDIDIIKSFKWVNSRITGFFIPRNYDYENNSGDLIIGNNNNKVNATVETFDNIKLFKFAYACIGKPEFVAIYGITRIRAAESIKIDSW